MLSARGHFAKSGGENDWGDEGRSTGEWPVSCKVTWGSTLEAQGPPSPGIHANTLLRGSACELGHR